jgi:hypothetical protein
MRLNRVHQVFQSPACRLQLVVACVNVLNWVGQSRATGVQQVLVCCFAAGVVHPMLPMSWSLGLCFGSVLYSWQ